MNNIKRHKNTKDLTKVNLPNGIIAIKFLYTNKLNKAVWLFRCHCGKEFKFVGSGIVSEHKKSCGCLKHRMGINNPLLKDYTNFVFKTGVKALNFVERINGKTFWNCLCPYCFSEFVTNIHDIQKEYVKSCGCLNCRVGEDSPSWNPDLTNEERTLHRKTLETGIWRKTVYERDNYTCQCCGDNKGHNLNAHHLANWADNPTLRYELDNGITLCETCHKAFHKKYGYKNTTAIQTEQFVGLSL